ncbi:MAG: cupin domain-containing protein [Candidatus Omnitrophica bacterium]|nr:cupin domain-containing protein [Candidatus Omnitrophota bacterium]
MKPPWSGELRLKIVPQPSGSSFVVGTHAIPPGGSIPLHRHHDHDEVLFIHKGQGRATVDQQAVTVLPGMLVHVPRECWYGLRNTGTGVLQITWTATPAGIEGFFRELSRLSQPMEAAAFQVMAAAYHLELRSESEGAKAQPASQGGRPRGRRRSRPRRYPRSSPPASATQAPVSAPAPTTPSAIATPQQPPPAIVAPTGEQPTPPLPPAVRPTSDRAKFPRGARRDRGPGRPPIQKPASQAQPPRPAKPDRRPHGHHRSRVKEVYMGGRWIRVAGEGPVISPGRDAPPQRPNQDDA